MSKKCELTGKIPLKGHKVSHANNKTKKRFLQNLKKLKFNIEILKSICPIDSQSQIKLLLDYLPNTDFESVPDPYFEGKFDEVFEIVYEACTSFLESLVKKA